MSGFVANWFAHRRKENTVLHDLGFTRSCCARDHLLITPDTHVVGPWPTLDGAQSIVHISPAVGARFALSTVRFGTGGKLSLPAAAVQRFVLVLDGNISWQRGGHDEHLSAGDFALLPAGKRSTLEACEESRILLIEKPFVPAASHDVAEPFTGAIEAIPPRPLVPNSRVQVRVLLPEIPALDLAVNVMEFPPGASLPFVEIHEMEHGLLMLRGQGIYRLGDHWHPVTAGDIIWMAPYCPQWFAALGEEPARYLLYKDWNRHPLARCDTGSTPPGTEPSNGGGW
jgi:(S)-ureidoglycine aminohydrolase